MNYSTSKATSTFVADATAVTASSSAWSRTFSAHRYYPWFVIGLCSLFLFYKYVLQVSPSVMTDELMSAFQVQGAGLGNLAATYFYAYLVAQFFVGPLLDRYSPRYLTGLAIMICGAGAMAFALADTLLQAGIARALMGVGTAFATVGYMKMSALWFKPNQVAVVDGLVATAAMVGAMSGQVPLTMLVTQVGWRDSLMFCGVVGVMLAVIFMVCVRDKKSLVTTSVTSSDSQSVFNWQNFSVLLKSKKNWLLTFYSGLAFTPVAVLGGLWGNPFFEELHHLTRTQAASFTSCIFLGLAVGGPLFGYLADRCGDRLKMMMWGTVLSLFALIIAMYVSSLPLLGFGAALFVFGLGAGGSVLSYPLGKSLNSLTFAATVVALINTGDALFGSLTEPMVGKLLDLLWQGRLINGVHYFSVTDYQVALLLLPAYLLGALLCLGGLSKIK